MTSTTSKRKTSSKPDAASAEGEVVAAKRKAPAKKTAEVAEVSVGVENAPVAEAPKRKSRSAAVTAEVEAAPAAKPKRATKKAATPATEVESAESLVPQVLVAQHASAEQTLVYSPEHRYREIARLAYLRAEARGFAPGDELADWYAAEAEYLAGA